MAAITRRTFLAIGCGAACAQALGCGSSGVTLAPTIVAGAATSFPVGTLSGLAGQGVAVGQDTGGYYALSLICTHAGCDMSVDGSVSARDIVCYCHNSVFNSQGQVLQGPANSSLPHFAVTKDASGQLTVHTDQEVSASTRTA
jgi:Rieske Fe-S protein